MNIESRSAAACLFGAWVLILAGTAGATLPPVTHDLRADYDASAVTGLNNGDLITTWVDSAGGDDNGTAAGYAPVDIRYVTNAAPSGLPGIRFDDTGASGDWFVIPSMTPVQVFFVAKETRAGRSSTVLGQSGRYDWHNGGPGGVFMNGYGNDKPNHWTGKLDGTGVDLLAQRFSLNTPFILWVDTSGAPAYVDRICSDRDGYPERTWGGEIYEILIYTAPLTPQEQNDVGYYLQQKWGLTGAYVASGPQPHLAASPVSGSLVDFGHQTAAGSPSTVTTITLTSDGDDGTTANITSAAFATGTLFAFDSTPGATPLPLPKGSSAAYGVKFLGSTTPGTYTDTITITTDVGNFTYNLSAVVDVPGPHTGDVDRDGIVNLSDFSILKSNFSQAGETIQWDQGDLDGDNKVTLADFSLLKAHYNHTGNEFSVPTIAVPEPGSAAALLLGLAGLMRRRIEA